MALLVPDVGEVVLLTKILGSGNNWTLKLFQSDTTPAEGDTAVTYTEATFSGYAAKTLTTTVNPGTTWGTPTTSDGTTSSTYEQQSWTCNGATSNTIYGYYIVDASTGTLILAERFASSWSAVLNATLNLTPSISLG